MKKLIYFIITLIIAVGSFSAGEFVMTNYYKANPEIVQFPREIYIQVDKVMDDWYIYLEDEGTGENDYFVVPSNNKLYLLWNERGLKENV